MYNRYYLTCRRSQVRKITKFLDFVLSNLTVKLTIYNNDVSIEDMIFVFYEHLHYLANNNVHNKNFTKDEVVNEFIVDAAAEIASFIDSLRYSGFEDGGVGEINVDRAISLQLKEMLELKM